MSWKNIPVLSVLIITAVMLVSASPVFADTTTGAVIKDGNGTLASDFDGTTSQINVSVDDVTIRINPSSMLYVSSVGWAQLTGVPFYVLNGSFDSLFDTRFAIKTTADLLSDSSNRRFVTDVQLSALGNISGNNTGDQIITLTGDVTGSGTGSFATNLALDSVSDAEIDYATVTLNDFTNDAGFVTTSDDLVNGSELDGVFSSNGILVRTGLAAYSTITDSSSNWNTAFGWGNHASAGYSLASAFGSDFTAWLTNVTFGGDVNGSYSNIQLGADSVGSSEISASAVGTSEVDDNSLTVSDLGADSVGSSELADDSVDTAAIQDGAVTNATVNDVDWIKITNEPVFQLASAMAAYYTSAQVDTLVTTLQNQIDANSTALNTEISERIADVNAEESERINSDATLQSSIDTINATIVGNTTALNALDAREAINNASQSAALVALDARESAHNTTLTNAIAAEAAARTASIASLELRAVQNTTGLDIYLSQGWNKFKLPWFQLIGTGGPSGVKGLDVGGDYSVNNVLTVAGGISNTTYKYIAYYNGTAWQTYVPTNATATTFTEFPTDATTIDFDYYIYMSNGARLTIGLAP